MDVDFIIKHLGLEPLPGEGGYYKETYRSDDILTVDALPSRYTVEKRLGTAIYYLVTEGTFSALHHLPSDEIFHFYLGDPVRMLQLYPDGTGKTFVLGNDLAEGHLPQVTVPRYTWQGMRLIRGGRFALMGTTVAPSFDFHDLELGDRKILAAGYPEFKDIIELLTNN